MPLPASRKFGGRQRGYFFTPLRSDNMFRKQIAV